MPVWEKDSDGNDQIKLNVVYHFSIEDSSKNYKSNIALHLTSEGSIYKTYNNLKILNLIYFINKFYLLFSNKFFITKKNQFYLQF